MYVRASGVAVAGSTTCSKRVLIPFSEPRVEDSNSGFLIAYSWLLLGCTSEGGGSSLEDGLIVTSSGSAAARLFAFPNILASAFVMACPICIFPFFRSVASFAYLVEIIPLVLNAISASV